MNGRRFFSTTGKAVGTGASPNWIASGVPKHLADAALWRIEGWRELGQDVRAGQVVQLGWYAGCRHPDLADAYAGELAAPGRYGDLRSGRAVCEEVLGPRRARPTKAGPGWARGATSSPGGSAGVFTHKREVDAILDSVADAFDVRTGTCDDWGAADDWW